MGFVCELLFLLLKVILHWIRAKEEEKYFLSIKQMGLQILNSYHDDFSENR